MPLTGALLTAYGLLWRAAEPLLRRHKRLRHGFAQRLVPDNWLPKAWAAPAAGARSRVWIQAASGGEARLVHALLPELARAGPLRALCTTCTRQGLEVLEALPAPPGCEVCPRHFPLDRPDTMRKALALARPGLIILLETELWPGLLRAAREQGVPVIVLNGRMTPKSRRAYGLIPGFWKALAPAAVLAVSPADAERFSGLFGLEAGLMPNIKFDLMVRAAGPEPAAPGTGLVLTLASVRREEEGALLPLIAALRGFTCPGGLRVVVAPRHMHRVDAWVQTLDAAGIPARPRSARTEAIRPDQIEPDQTGPGRANPPVLIWDSFGDLPSLYAESDAVFVGGSLAPLGGQNFLEPLACGLRPLVGPFLDNFLWAGEELFALGLVRRAASAEELGRALREELESLAALAPDLRVQRAREVRRDFARWLQTHAGGSARAGELALSYLCV